MLPALLCLIVGITDGDTLTARCDTLERRDVVQVRLSEIDAPEKRQPFGERSRQHLAELCFQHLAELRPVKRDRYGRMVAQVTCQGRDVDTEMVRAGMAWQFVRYSDDAALRDLQADARAAKRGLWAEAGPMAPWEWRAKTKTRP
jgi:endonuclease YncB( thermonuclease family)